MERFFIYYQRNGWFAADRLIQKGEKTAVLRQNHPRAVELMTAVSMLKAITRPGELAGSFERAEKTLNTQLKGWKAVAFPGTNTHPPRLMLQTAA